MAWHNELAVWEIFNHYNPNYASGPRSLQQIDLHGLYVKEALKKVEDHIKLCVARRIRRTDIIVGRGLHSPNATSRLRPAVLLLLESVQGVEIDKKNGDNGSIVVKLGSRLRN